MTAQKAKNLERKLLLNGYRKFTQGLSTNEHYGYAKTIGNTLIEYRFWDWTRERGVAEDFGVDVLIINSDTSRCDLIITTDNLEIERIEWVASNFNDFCRRNELGEFEES